MLGTTIRFEPVPNAQGRLISAMGEVLFLSSGASEQRIVFPIRLANSSYNQVKLATGESISEIEGYAELRRGLQQTDDGSPIHGELRYNGPEDADENGPAKAASFTVVTCLEDRLFDQLVQLCQTAGPPIIDLSFAFRSAVIYGDAPDGSEVLWNNEPKIWESVVGVTLTHTLTRNHQ